MKLDHTDMNDIFSVTFNLFFTNKLKFPYFNIILMLRLGEIFFKPTSAGYNNSYGLRNNINWCFIHKSLIYTSL